MDDYQALVREYQKKEAERKEYCNLIRISPASLVRRTHLPRNIHSGKLLYLGYGRNAWHSTWIRRYYPGSISFFEKDLQLLCETRRVQGSVFRIEPVPVVYLEYQHDVIVLLAINDRLAAAYHPLLQNIFPFRLDAFWLSEEFEADNWLITFRLPAWRPDLYPKRFHRMSSAPRGAGRPLGWSRHEADETQSGVSIAFSEFMPRLLKIT
tara:strand:- start:905 stop:1531 length:627 start_codon:yes stop_codon:yes gene_type:complete